MKTIKLLLSTTSFRHTFAILLLACFMTLCYWRKKDDKLSSLDSQITLVGTLLALAVKRYFDDKPKTNELQETETNRGLHTLLPTDNTGGSTTNAPCNTCGRL